MPGISFQTDYIFHLSDAGNEKKIVNKIEETVERIVAMAKVLFGLHMVIYNTNVPHLTYIFLYFASETDYFENIIKKIMIMISSYKTFTLGI